MSTGQLVMFESTAVSGLELGADALLYVMAHGHTISIPDQALMFAEKVAVISLRRTVDADGRPVDPAPAVLADVNRALDLIAQSLRRREAIDREGQTAGAVPALPPSSDLAGGHKVKTVKPVPVVPPAGATAQMRF